MNTLKALYDVVCWWPNRLAPCVLSCLLFWGIVFFLGCRFSQLPRMGFFSRHRLLLLAALLLGWLIEAYTITVAMVWALFGFNSLPYSLVERTMFANDAFVVSVLSGILGVGAMTCVTALTLILMGNHMPKAASK